MRSPSRAPDGDRGVRWKLSSSPPWNGSSGSTTVACSDQSETCLPPRPKRATMPNLRHSQWRRDSKKPASGKPGAVHSVEIEDAAGEKRNAVAVEALSELLVHPVFSNPVFHFELNTCV